VGPSRGPRNENATGGGAGGVLGVSQAWSPSDAVLLYHIAAGRKRNRSQTFGFNLTVGAPAILAIECTEARSS
jgi:hypothetical protein